MCHIEMLIGNRGAKAEKLSIYKIQACYDILDARFFLSIMNNVRWI